jgi:hypothetical protein
MKTSRVGSRSGCASNQASRRLATSGRSCSLACAVFFDGHRVAVKEAPDRAGREGGIMIAAKHVGQFDEGDVHLRVNRAQDHIPISLDPMRSLITALRLRARGTRRVPFSNPADRTRHPNAKPFCGRPPGQATRHSRDHTRTKVTR